MSSEKRYTARVGFMWQMKITISTNYYCLFVRNLRPSVYSLARDLDGSRAQSYRRNIGTIHCQEAKWCLQESLKALGKSLTTRAMTPLRGEGFHGLAA